MLFVVLIAVFWSKKVLGNVHSPISVDEEYYNKALNDLCKDTGIEDVTDCRTFTSQIWGLSIPNVKQALAKIEVAPDGKTRKYTKNKKIDSIEYKSIGYTIQSVCNQYQVTNMEQCQAFVAKSWGLRNIKDALVEHGFLPGNPVAISKKEKQPAVPNDETTPHKPVEPATPTETTKIDDVTTATTDVCENKCGRFGTCKPTPKAKPPFKCQCKDAESNILPTNGYCFQHDKEEFCKAHYVQQLYNSFPGDTKDPIQNCLKVYAAANTEDGRTKFADRYTATKVQLGELANAFHVHASDFLLCCRKHGGVRTDPEAQGCSCSEKFLTSEYDHP